MSCYVAHFAINTDNLEATRAFYEDVFGWTFKPWGPPGFLQIETGSGPMPLMGAMQKRRTLVPGIQTHGFECTIAVPDVEQTAAAIQKHGCKIVMPKATIAHVGHLIFFEDPGGNLVGAMQYDANAQ